MFENKVYKSTNSFIFLQYKTEMQLSSKMTENNLQFGKNEVFFC